MGEVVRVDGKALVAALQKAEKTLITFLGSPEGAQRALKVAFVLVRRTPDLQKCSVESIVNGVLQSAQFGLELGSEAYLVPFWNKDLKTFEAQWIADWKGLVRLAVRTGALVAGHGDLVYKDDEYVYRRTDTGVEFLHDRRRFGARAKEDNVKAHVEAGCQGVYFIGYPPNGAPPAVAELSVDDVEYVRRTFSRQPDGPLWTKRWSMGAIKTAAKQALKTIPLTPQLAEALEVDNRHETGIKTGVLDEDQEALKPLKEPRPLPRAEAEGEVAGAAVAEES